MKQSMQTFILFIVIAFGVFGCAPTSTSESTGQYIDNTAITSKVKTELARQMGVSTLTDIDVTSYRYTVQLSGFVNSQEDIDIAGQIAASVAGVDHVDNRLSVKPQ